MPNKINGLPSITPTADLTVAGPGPKRPADVARTPPADSDRVDLSAARLLGGSAEAPFDAARVDRLRQSIADGSYQVDANRIADRLVEAQKGGVREDGKT